jgi:CheY-like chemotaxis protein
MADFRYPLPATIQTDPVRLRQILVNLVGNAVKFTERGGVRISVSFFPGSPARLCFAIHDTGIGMSPEGMKKLFQPFSQIDTSHTRRFGGTGLGLVICKRFAELLRGNITVDSDVGQGSTFTLSLELDPADPADLVPSDPRLLPADLPRTTTTAELFQGRVLLAEDAPDNQALLSLILQKAGVEVDAADNGRVAYQMAVASAAEGRPYDLILMDVQMPDMDGCEATERLRKFGWEGRIVALTAHAMAGDRQRCLAAGCDDYLSKPATGRSLFDVLRRYLKPQPPPTKEASACQPGLLDDPRTSPAERAKLMALFTDNLQNRLKDIQRAMQNGDRKLMGAATHALVGAAGMFGFPQIASTARAIDERLRAGSTPAQMAELVKSLIDLCQRIERPGPCS